MHFIDDYITSQESYSGKNRVEVNNCVNYTLKRTLIDMREKRVQRGIPNRRMTLDKTTEESLLPTPIEAVRLYRAVGGTITEEHPFGLDLLSDNLEKLATR